VIEVETNGCEADMRVLDELPSAREQQEEIERELRKSEFDATVRRLAALKASDPIEFERQRIRESRRLGVRASRFDEALANRRTTNSKPLAGSPLEFPEPEAWPEPVGGAELLDELAGAFRRHLALLDGAAEAISLWAVFSYCIDSFRFNPRLAFLSPTKQCGKSTALGMLAEIVSRSLPTSSVTPAAVFRVIEAKRPTLVIDEADTFLPDNEVLRGILNSGHSRPTAFVLRTVGDEFEPRKFSTWAAIVIACIGRLPDTLSDRSVVIPMRRKTSSEVVQSFDDEARAVLVPLVRKIRRWVNDSYAMLADLRPTMPAGFTNRLADNWRPLLAIADAAGGNWPALAREAAVKLSGKEAREDDDVKVALLSDIRELFEQRRCERLFSEDICVALAVMEGRPWAEWKQGKPISKAGLARLLKAFSIQPGPMRNGAETGKGYLLSNFREAFDRYLVPIQSVTTSQTLGENTFTDCQIVTTEKPVTVGEVNFAHAEKYCDGVTVGIPQLSERRGSAPPLPPSAEEF